MIVLFHGRHLPLPSTHHILSCCIDLWVNSVLGTVKWWRQLVDWFLFGIYQQKQKYLKAPPWLNFNDQIRLQTFICYYNLKLLSNFIKRYVAKNTFWGWSEGYVVYPFLCIQSVILSLDKALSLGSFLLWLHVVGRIPRWPLDSCSLGTCVL